MKRAVAVIGVICLCAVVVGCVGPKKYTMQVIPSGSYGDKVESKEMLLEEGHFMGNSASRQEASLAEMIIATNNNSTAEFAKIETLGTKDLKIDEDTLALLKEDKEIDQKTLTASEQALALLKSFEALSKLQGTGEITLFFPVNQHKITSNSENHRRLVEFMDYLATRSLGRKVKFLLVGSASATGVEHKNVKLSDHRANAPVEIIDTYLMNVPHEILKVYGVGDSLSPKDAKAGKKFQNVRVIAVYEESQAPQLPPKK
jgi:hypothetical protein